MQQIPYPLLKVRVANDIEAHFLFVNLKSSVTKFLTLA